MYKYSVSIQSLSLMLISLLIFDFLDLFVSTLSNKQIVVCIYTQSLGITQSTVYVTEELSVLVYDVDTVIVIIRCNDVTLTICGDSSWIELFVLWSRSMYSVPESQFPGLIDHHYCISSIVSHTDIRVPVLTNVFTATKRTI